MSYEVLTQKWRPHRFSDVVGQEHVITTLKNQLLNDRIGHAYLFSGPRGTGKTTVARILAKAVNCQNREFETDFSHEKSAEPCNKCETCLAISNSTSFDVTEMDAASNRGIDEIRSLREKVKLAPSLCQYKVYIIDEAHMLTTEAFNALLKTLEEPPEHVIFILITTERHRILKTILSRCQDFEFRFLSHSQITSHLKKLCESENFSVTDDGLELIAQKSEGCLRDAQNLLEQLFAASGQNKELDLDNVSRLLGFGSISLLSNLTEQIIDQNIQDCLKLVNQLAEQGADLSQCLRSLITDFRSLRLLSVSSQLEEIIDVSNTRLEWMKSQTENVSLERISKIVKILMKAEGDIKQHGYELINFESALIEACSIQEGFKLTEAFKKLTEIQGMLEEMSRSQKSNLSVPQPDATTSPSVSLGSPATRTTKDPNRLVYDLPEPLYELSPEKVVERLINLLNKDGHVELVYDIERRKEAKIEDNKLILVFSSSAWSDGVKRERSIIEDTILKAVKLSNSTIDEHEDSDEDNDLQVLPTPDGRNVATEVQQHNPAARSFEDRYTAPYQENNVALSEAERPEPSNVDMTIVEEHNNQPSKHQLFAKVTQDKIVSYVIKKFKGILIDVKPKD